VPWGPGVGLAGKNMAISRRGKKAVLFNLIKVVYQQKGVVIKDGERFAVVCREYVFCDKRTCGNPVVTFQIKKRINTKVFFDRTVVRHMGGTLIRVGTNEGDQPMAQADWKIPTKTH